MFLSCRVSVGIELYQIRAKCLAGRQVECRYGLADKRVDVIIVGDTKATKTELRYTIGKARDKCARAAMKARMLSCTNPVTVHELASPVVSISKPAPRTHLSSTGP